MSILTSLNVESREMKRALVRMAILVGSLLLPAVASAQTTGILEGNVFDQMGLPLPGVKITATSPTQIGGAKVAYSNDQGVFRITNLIPGKFLVTAEAPKLKIWKTENLRISINSTTEINVVMEVETETETTVIKEKPATVNVKDPKVKETFDEEFINNLPVASRDYQGVATLAAGVTDTGTGNPEIRGGASFNNSYTVDGVDTTDPVTGTFGMNFNFDAMADVEVSTAALGAELSSTTGGNINIVTKSGSNKFELDTSATFTDYHLQFNRDNLDRGSGRFGTGNINVGGPILKDKLWYFASAQYRHAKSQIAADPNGIFPDHPPFIENFFEGFAKLTWQASPRNKIQMWTNFSPAEIQNEFQSLFVEPEAEARQYQQTNIVSLAWEALLRDDLFFRTQVAFQREYLEVGPESCKWDPNCANVPASVNLANGVLQGNYTSIVKDARQDLQVNSGIEWFKDSKQYGSHDVKFGFRSRFDANPSSQTRTGDTFYDNYNLQPYSRTQYCANDPSLSGGVCRPGWLHTNVGGRRANMYLTDGWKPTRYVTIQAGGSLNYGYSNDERQATVTQFLTPTPTVFGIWDATHDGRTAFRGSYSQYVDTGFLALARFAGRGLSSKSCNWDPDSHDYIFNCQTQGGDSGITVGLPDGPDGKRQKLNAPRTHEVTAGAEREIVQGVSIGADFIYRKFNHLFEDIETNLVWNQGGTGLRDDGGYKNGKAQYVFDLETPDAAWRRYRAVTAVIRKKEGRFKLIASYTWSENYGQQNGTFASSYLDNPRQNIYWTGFLPNDSRHVIKMQGSFQMTPWLSIGGTYDFETGTPYSRYFFNPYYRYYADFKAQQGYDPGVNINDPGDDRALRMPDISLLAFQVRANLKKFTGQQLETWMDVFNVLGLRTTTGVYQNDGPLFGQQTSRLPPTRARIGVRFRY